MPSLEESMNISAQIQQSVHIITEYYENRLQPFFDAIDDDLLWIGPAERQWMQGKENILNAFTQEEGRHHLTFRMSNISATPISCGTHACEIILTYLVYTYYPNGAMTVHDQRLHFTWRDKKVTGPDGKKHLVPKAAVIHISNAFPYDDRDKIYPVHYDEIKSRRHSRLQPAPASRFPDRTMYVIFWQRIRFFTLRQDPAPRTRSFIP